MQYPACSGRKGDPIVDNPTLTKYFPGGESNQFPVGRKNAMTQKEIFDRIEKAGGGTYTSEVFSRLVRKYAVRSDVVILRWGHLTKAERKRIGQEKNLYYIPTPAEEFGMSKLADFCPIKHCHQVLMRISKFQFPIQHDDEGKPIMHTGKAVSLVITNLNLVPVRLRLILRPYLNNELLKINFSDQYSGKKLLKLNPGSHVFRRLNLHVKPRADEINYRVEFFWSITDPSGKEFERYPFSFVWNDPDNDWVFEPEVMSENPFRTEEFDSETFFKCMP